MKTHTRTKMVHTEYLEYETSDGRMFTDKDKATHHQAILDGKRKSCSSCSGEGKITTYVEESVLKSGEHFASGTETVQKSRLCTVCNGKGYLELKWS
jgi:hypothetical protein